MTTHLTDVRLERATERDVPVILSLIKALADYEHMAGDVVADEALVHESLFGPAPSAEVVIARAGVEPVGFAVWFHNLLDVSWAGGGCIWKICSSCPSGAAVASAVRFSSISRSWPWSASAGAWNGRSSIGTSRRSGSTDASERNRSMRVEPRPTRAEVSDAANAVDDGVDAIMLAGETAAGAYPARAVQTLDHVIRDAESVPTTARFPPALDPTGSLHGRALCEAAVTLATHGHADAIVAVTREGKTARLLSALRPGAPIFAATAHARSLRRSRSSGASRRS